MSLVSLDTNDMSHQLDYVIISVSFSELKRVQCYFYFANDLEKSFLEIIEVSSLLTYGFIYVYALHCMCVPLHICISSQCKHVDGTTSDT
jgi:hypothetical protein